MASTYFRLTPSEQQWYREQGYLVRHAQFDPDEIAAITAECESVVDRLVRNRQARRAKFGSYTFDSDDENGVIIKWEGESDVVHGLEPFVHLSEPLARSAYDARFVEPMIDILGCAEPALFTEKLNLKRPRHGGANPMHQDYPYWVNAAEVAAEVATAMLFLDDSNLENGCLHVVPGSHLRGAWPLRKTDDRFGANELDRNAFGEIRLEPLEVEAGALVFFGPFLVHQSAPNLSDTDRRALLYSYQPPGRRTQLENMRRWQQERRFQAS